MNGIDPKGSRTGAAGVLFFFGIVLPVLWALWVIARIGIANAPHWGRQTQNPTYPRDMGELWATAIILTLTALVFIIMITRPTGRRVRTTIFVILAGVAAAANWAILLIP